MYGQSLVSELYNKSALIFFLFALREDITTSSKILLNFNLILRNVVHICLAHGLRLKLQSTDSNLNFFTLLFNNTLTQRSTDETVRWFMTLIVYTKVLFF